MKRIGFTLVTLMLMGSLAVANLEAQTTIRQSYYVNAAAGDDSNNGRSEGAAFKTMQKAIDSAKMGVVKTITIIGTVGGFPISGTGQDEITITGKPDASEREKARINGGVSVGRGGTVVKFMYVTIENPSREDYACGISTDGKVTLGRNTVIQNCRTGISYIESSSSSLILTDNAVIIGCQDVGVSGVSVIMTDDSSITNNGIGIRNSSPITMSGNARISNNRNGGVKCDNNGTPFGTLTISENAEISNNTSLTRRNYDREIWGGGVYIGKLVMNGGKIINNTAAKQGGGVFCVSAEITGGEISGNKAERGGGIYFSGTSTISGGAISGNRAEYGAGIFVPNRASLTQSGGSITGNQAEFVGGGIYAENGARYTSTGGTVTGNTAGDGVGNDVFNQ